MRELWWGQEMRRGLDDGRWCPTFVWRDQHSVWGLHGGDQRLRPQSLVSSQHKASPDTHQLTGHQGALRPQTGKDPDEQVQREVSKVIPESIQGFLLSLNHKKLWRSCSTQFLMLAQKDIKKIISTLSHTHSHILSHMVTYIQKPTLTITVTDTPYHMHSDTH
jgi:hypothetical protein